jgi:threonyl-tRNA synthetase
MDTM